MTASERIRAARLAADCSKCGQSGKHDCPYSFKNWLVRHGK